MEPGKYSKFSVGDWRVEPELNRIRLGSQTTTLRPQVMELLVYLAQQDGRVVSADELLDNLWAGKVVTGNAVYNCVAELRHALTDDKDATPYVETVPKKGYRLLAPVAKFGGKRNGDKVSFVTSKKRVAMMVVASTAVVVISWLSLSPQLTTEVQTTASNPGSPSAPLVEHRPADAAQGLKSLLLPLRLPRYADASKSYTWPSIALAPDGRQIAYIGFESGDIHLYLKRADDPVARRIFETEGAAAPFFSPGGDWVGFFADGKVKRVHTAGGRPVVVGSVPGVPTGASWGADDYIYFGVGYRSCVQRISSSGGTVEDVTSVAVHEWTHRRPHALPGGRALLYQIGSQHSVMQSEPAEIWVLDRRTGDRRFLIEGANPKYSNGSLIFQRAESNGRSIWSADFDLDSMTLSGQPVVLVTTPIEDYDVSRSGALLYVQQRKVLHNVLRLVDEKSSAELFVSDEPISYPRFSFDDRTLAVSIGSKNETETWIFDLAGDKAPAQLTTDKGAFHTWSADGTRIAYYRWTEGIFAQTLRTTGPPERLVDVRGFLLPLDWTTGGLLYLRPDPRARHVMFFQASDGTRQPIVTDAVVPLDAKISPDGQWLAYSRIDAGRPDVVVQAFPAGERRWRVSANLAGDHPKWSADGRWLYFESFNQLMAVSVEDDDLISFGTPRTLLEFSGRSDITYDPFDVASDGSRFAVVDTIYGDPPEHVYISDWRQLLSSR